MVCKVRSDYCKLRNVFWNFWNNGMDTWLCSKNFYNGKQAVKFVSLWEPSFWFQDIQGDFLRLHRIFPQNVLILLMFEDTCWGLRAFWCVLLWISPEDVIFDLGVCNLLLWLLQIAPAETRSRVLLTIAFEILLNVLQFHIYFRYCMERANSYYLMNFLLQ